MYNGIAPLKLKTRLEASPVMTVRGVFSSGIYLESDSGNIIMIHDIDYGSVPFGIGIKDYSRQKSLSKLLPGTEASYENSKLHFMSAYDNVIILEFMPECRPIALSIETFEEFASKALVESRKSAFAYYALVSPDRRCRNDLDDIFAAKAFAPMNRLDRSLLGLDESAVCDSLKCLIGFGRGLTPSCDDFIVGELTALSTIAEIRPEVQKVSYILAESVRKTVNNTNIYSSAYLKAAAAGEYFSLLIDCLTAEGTEQMNNICRLLKVGNSSGGDMLSGMLRGCRI